MGGRSARRTARVLPLLVLAGLLVGTVTPAGAAPDHKRFSTEITPDHAVAGSPATFRLTITNDSKNTDLGSAQITVPDGFTVNSASVELGRGWSLENQHANPLFIRADSSHARLAPGESIYVDLNIVTPFQDGDTTYTFGVHAKQANNFNGKGNDLNGAGPSVKITGVAVDCSTGGDCSARFEEGSTSADVSTRCEDLECSTLVLDLGDEYCESGYDCIGTAAFWRPPVAVDHQLNLMLQVPADCSSGDDCESPSPTLYIVDDEGGVAECGEGSLSCDYSVELIQEAEEGPCFWVFTATFYGQDPRAFAS